MNTIQTMHPNMAIMQQFNPANIAGCIDIIAEDAVFHYFNPMLPDMQGDYLGRQGFKDFFGKLAGKTEGTFKVTPLSITPMGDEFVVTYVQDNMILNGRQMEINAVVVWRIVDEKIKEAWDIPAIYTAERPNT